MANSFFSIPSRDSTATDVVYADPERLDGFCYAHYAFAVGSESRQWTELLQRRGIPFGELRDWERFRLQQPKAMEMLAKAQPYTPGQDVLKNVDPDVNFQINTTMRLGALELVANISSGRIAANDKDPFPHQLALLQFMKANQGDVRRLLIADEVGLGKTIEVGLILRDILTARGSLDTFSCVYFTSGGLRDDAVGKLSSVLQGAIGDQQLVSRVDSLARFGSSAGGSTPRGVHVASMHAARLYTADRKSELPTGVKPEIVIIDECHHCASENNLAGIKDVSGRTATLTYVAAHQMVNGEFWPKSSPPKLVILMSATPFRSREQFTNLLRLLCNGIGSVNSYGPGIKAADLIDTLKQNPKQASIVWRQQEGVRTWTGERLFPNLTIVRPHRPGEGPTLQSTGPAYLAVMDEIKTEVRKTTSGHGAKFGGFAISQLEKKLTSSSLAGACWLFSWCVRHCLWDTKAVFEKDQTPATQSLRELIREISRKLASFDPDKNSPRHARVFLASERFAFEAATLAQKGNLSEIYRLNETLRRDEDDNDDEAFVLSPDEVLKLTALASKLLRFSHAQGEGGSDSGVEDAKLNWLRQMLSAFPESRFLVFTESLQTCAIVQAAFGDICGKLTGDMGLADRDRVASEFRDPKRKVRILVATSAADEGFDLQVSNRVVHWDLSSSPAVLMQRNGRVARLGQVADVTAYYLILSGTHEERRDNALLQKFQELGIDDENLRLKILGTLGDEELSQLEDAVEGASPQFVGDILRKAREDNDFMDKQLAEINANLELRAVMDRQSLCSRLETWNMLGLPDEVEADLKFGAVKWRRPVFGVKAALKETEAKVAKIRVGDDTTQVTFDPEFTVFAPEAASYKLAGLRPWTKRSGDRVTKIRPDKRIDRIGDLACSLVRLPSADFALIARDSLAEVLGTETNVDCLLFATHPMREAENRLGTGTSQYLTFYPLRKGPDGKLESLVAGGATAEQVHALIGKLEESSKHTSAEQRNALLSKGKALDLSEQAGNWLNGQISLGGTVFAPSAYFLPVPVALVLVCEPWAEPLKLPNIALDAIEALRTVKGYDGLRTAISRLDALSSASSAVVNALRGPFPPERLDALQSYLATHQSGQYLEQLVLAKTEPLLLRTALPRVLALRAGMFSDEYAAGILRGLLDAPEIEIRVAAIDALTAAGSVAGSVRSVLERLSVSDPNSAVREAASVALSDLEA